MLEVLVQKEGYSYQRMDGKMPPKDRVDMVEKFNNDPSQFCFLLSTRAGGVGLNLTSAKYVVLFFNNILGL